MPKPKKSKRASQWSVTKRGALGEDDNLTSTKPPIYNDESDIIVEQTDVPQDAPEAVVISTPLDEVVDYDETSIESTQENEIVPTTSTSEPSRQSEEAEILQPAEPQKRRKLDMGELMVKTNVTKKTGLGKPVVIWGINLI